MLHGFENELLYAQLKVVSNNTGVENFYADEFQTDA